jgi:hypothetical protein
MKAVTMYLQPGIGDNLWVLMRFWHWFNQPIHTYKYQVVILPQEPKRAHQLFEFLIAGAGVLQSIETIRYADPSEKFPDGSDMIPERLMDLFEEKHGAANTGWSIERHNPDNPIYMSINRWLEQGFPIEKFTNSSEALMTDGSDFLKLVLDGARSYVKKPEELGDLEVTKNAIGVYMSSHASNRNWGFWGATEWITYLTNYGQHRDFYFIGADYDRDLASDVIREMTSRGYQCKSFFECSLAETIWLLDKLPCLIAFPSGIPILSTYLNVRTMMFYPEHLEKMRYAWPPKLALLTQRYVAPMMGPVAQHIDKTTPIVDSWLN